jgi:hypothetical protein
VLICKLDASGTDRPNKFVTVAGYIGLLPNWTDFEINARPILDREGVDILHAKEFYDTKRCFGGWSRDKKEAFIQELQGVSLGRLEFGVSYTVEKEKFVDAKRQHNVSHRESPFGYCFRQITYGVMGDEIISEVLKRGDNITFILESGDKNGEDAHRIFNELKKLSPAFDRMMYSFGFADKNSSVGLQWADFLATTTRRYVDKHDKLGQYPEEPRIISILRNRIYMMDHVAASFVLSPKRARRA